MNNRRKSETKRGIGGDEPSVKTVAKHRKKL